jgi:hypothetical protein
MPKVKAYLEEFILWNAGELNHNFQRLFDAVLEVSNILV